MSLFDKINKGTYTLQPTDLDAVTWTNSPTGSTWGQSNNEITFANMTGSTEVMYYDIGTVNISDNQWILRFKLDIDSWSQGTTASSDWVIFGLSSTTGNSDTSQDSMVGVIRNNSSSQSLAITRTNGTTLNSQLGSTDLEVLGATGSFYVEMIRTSDANYTLNVRSGSHSGTLLGSQDYTNASGVGGLRYIKAMNHLTSNTNADASGSFGEIEFYNGVTSVTNVFPQRVVENFSGSALDTDRWNIAHSAGTDSNSPNGMANTVDGGFYWTTHSSNTGYYGIMNFSGKRQFNPISSAWIAITRNHTTTNTAHYAGLHENSYFMVSASGNVTNYQLSTRNDTQGTGNTDTSVASDTNWHTWKGETDGTTVTLHGDGVLEASRTYPIPTTATGTLEPFFQVYNNNGGTSKTSSIRYFEAYNT